MTEQRVVSTDCIEDTDGDAQADEGEQHLLYRGGRCSNPAPSLTCKVSPVLHKAVKGLGWPHCLHCLQSQITNFWPKHRPYQAVQIMGLRPFALATFKLIAGVMRRKAGCLSDGLLRTSCNAATVLVHRADAQIRYSICKQNLTRLSYNTPVAEATELRCHEA